MKTRAHEEFLTHPNTSYTQSCSLPRCITSGSAAVAQDTLFSCRSAAFLGLRRESSKEKSPGD